MSRKTSVILEEIKDIEMVIEEGRKIIKTFPNDFAIELSLKTDMARHLELLSELKEALCYEGKHVLRFIIKNIEKYSSVGIDRFFDSVKTFEDVITAVSKIIYRQGNDSPKLAFNTTFPSSFGIMLSTEMEDNELISKTYSTFDTTFKILTQLNDDSNIHSVLKKELINKRLLHKFKKFYQAQSSYSNDIELIWGDTNKDEVITIIPSSRSTFVADALSKYEEVPDEVRNISCIIKGFSLIRNKIEIIYDGKVINAKSTDEQILEVSSLLNNVCDFEVRITKKINENTDEFEEKWEVVRIL